MKSQIEQIKCSKCGNSVRVPVDKNIDLVACVCGYYTAVTHG